MCLETLLSMAVFVLHNVSMRLLTYLGCRPLVSVSGSCDHLYCTPRHTMYPFANCRPFLLKLVEKMTLQVLIVHARSTALLMIYSGQTFELSFCSPSLMTCDQDTVDSLRTERSLSLKQPMKMCSTSNVLRHFSSALHGVLCRSFIALFLM